MYLSFQAHFKCRWRKVTKRFIVNYSYRENYNLVQSLSYMHCPNNEDAVNVLFWPSCCQSHQGVSEPLKAEQKKIKNK